MLFNIRIGNRDDHLRNHGFIRTPSGWRLAPAYDMLPIMYAPQSGVELVERKLSPALPNERENWLHAANTTLVFWRGAEADERISSDFWRIAGVIWLTS